MKTHRIFLLAAGLLVSQLGLAEGSVEAGQQKAVTCAACHGQDGNSLNPEWPSLAGQNQKYLVSTLQAFKSGKRDNVLMTGQVMGLSDEDIRDIAAFYAAQPPARLAADPALVEAGQRLYRGGNIERGISACIACHGPTGRGNPAAGFPSLSGQHATYTKAQLKAYASKQRKSDDNQIMRSISGLMNDDDIAAVAAYIQGLR